MEQYSNFGEQDSSIVDQISKNLIYEIVSQPSKLSRILRNEIRRLPLHIRRAVGAKPYNGCSPLLIACKRGKVKIVKFLVQVCDANFEQRVSVPCWDNNNVHKVTLLCYFCVYGNIPVVKCLVRLGADTNALSDIGSTPLRIACYSRNFALVKYLVEHGADVRKPNSYGETYLIDCFPSVLIGKYLLSRGAYVNARDVRGKTALHYAVEKNDLAFVQMLLDNGADPYDKTDSGDDALQLACIVGTFDIIIYLIRRIPYSIERLISVVELMGSTLIHCHIRREAVLFWRLAQQTRMAHRIQKNPPIPLRSAYGYTEEFTTLAELEELTPDMDELRMQSLLIQERILGIDHETVLLRLMERGAFLKRNLRFEECLDLWLLTLQMRVQKHTILHCDTCHTARAIVRLMVDGTIIPQFRFVYDVFQLLTSNIVEIQQLLSIRPVYRRQQLNYDCILQCLKYIIYLLHSVEKSEAALQRYKRSVHHLVCNNIRTTLSSETLLHLAVSQNNIVESEYFPNEDLGIFPNTPVAKLLLECGAPANECDSTGSTPLLAFLSHHYEKELVNALVEHGTHLDLPNKFGDRASALLGTNPENDVPLGNHISLKCISSNAIVKFGIPYRNKCSLGRFVCAHGNNGPAASASTRSNRDIL